MLHAYIDDSLQKDKVLILGGFVAPPEKWALFSIDWKAHLKHARLSSFHMAELYDRRKNEELWERMPWFYGVIRQYVQIGIAFAIPLEIFSKVLTRFPLIHKNAGNPYFWAIKGIINLTAQCQRDVGITERVDFIFDERREEAQVRSAWEVYKSTIPDSELAVTGAEPKFADDEKVIPLQAADMWVWWCRYRWMEAGSLMNIEKVTPWGKLAEMPGILFEWTENDMELEFSRISQRYRAFLNPRNLMHRAVTISMRFANS